MCTTVEQVFEPFKQRHERMFEQIPRDSFSAGRPVDGGAGRLRRPVGCGPVGCGER
jgi:hypothetical protein